MEDKKIDLNILLLDDDSAVLDQLGIMILEIGMASSRKLDQPWRIKLGDQQVEVFCKFIGDPDDAQRVFNKGSRKQEFADVDVILLDNDWETKGRDRRFGLDILRSNEWRRGWGPFLALFTASRTYEPKFVYEALSLGADALINKEEKTHLLNVLVAAVERKQARIEFEKIQKLGGLLTEGDRGLISNSEAMKRTLQEAAFVAPWSKESVLLLGDIGTGKTRLSRAIHQCSPRAKGPFITLDPRQVAESLLQSELFGVERGAFTNALARKGVLEMADGGTLFIDELQNMPMEMQEALLNIIEGRPFRKVGDAREKKVDVRFIFASNADPEELVKQGSLRKDFLSRIATHTIKLPRLRDRGEDIPQLAKEFVNEFYSDNLPGSRPPDLSTTAIEALQHSDWPYNVRSLRNTMRRTLARMPAKDIVEREDLVLEEVDTPSPVNQDDVKQILEVAPRAGSQRVVLDCLLQRMSKPVPYEGLNELIGEASSKDKAGNNLSTVVSRLRTRLHTRGFDIVQDRNGYMLVKVA